MLNRVNILFSSLIIVYPNPASSFIILPAGSNNLKIYSISGNVVYESFSSEATVNINELSKGGYFVYSQNNDGKVYHSNLLNNKDDLVII
jgi:hypothetical protein